VEREQRQRGEAGVQRPGRLARVGSGHPRPTAVARRGDKARLRAAQRRGRWGGLECAYSRGCARGACRDTPQRPRVRRGAAVSWRGQGRGKMERWWQGHGPWPAGSARQRLGLCRDRAHVRHGRAVIRGARAPCLRRRGVDAATARRRRWQGKAKEGAVRQANMIRPRLHLAAGSVTVYGVCVRDGHEQSARAGTRLCRGRDTAMALALCQ